jgi:hypothetical protein
MFGRVSKKNYNILMEFKIVVFFKKYLAQRMYYINFIFCDKNVYNFLVLTNFKLLYKLVVSLTHPQTPCKTQM